MWLYWSKPLGRLALNFKMVAVDLVKCINDFYNSELSNSQYIIF